MKSYWLYCLQVFFLAPIWLFKDKQNRVKYFLRLLVPAGPFVQASFYISELESGNYTNTNTLSYNNPWSMRVSQSTPVKVTATPQGFANYRSLASAVYDYVHRQAVRFPSVMKKYQDDQVNYFVTTGENTDYSSADAVKTAIVSLVYEMIATGWLGTNPPFGSANTYSTAVINYATAEEKSGLIYTGLKRQKRGYMLITLAYIALIVSIILLCYFNRSSSKRKINFSAKT